MIPKQLAILGIQQHHLETCRLPPSDEAALLIDAGLDIFDRPLQMTPETYQQWKQMEAAALSHQIHLQVVSAYRSVDYQCQLIRTKLRKGKNIDEILKVNAIPGFSEHHTGRALDLTTPDCAPLETEFELTPAFEWLSTNAKKYRFSLSYPKDNPSGIDYEPWHWALNL